MKTTPPKGMKDYLPEETALRSYVEGKILDTYRKYGFQRITTPIPETAENLEKSEGGENLGLIFQVMKRGEKLDKALLSGQPLWYLGLRYDLTVPMVRYYSANKAKLPSPFKCIQIDRVYRAEQPQRGRLREFMQCDIDIIGTGSIDAEMELIAVTAEALTGLGFSGFVVKINDRELVNRLLLDLGFGETQMETACIALDKLDKVGVAGVAAFMGERDLDQAAIQRLACMLDGGAPDLAAVSKYLPGNDGAGRLCRIMDTLNGLSPDWTVQFDLTVIRGQGYYTGTVFEIACEGYKGAVAGGGRYDTLVGKFTGKDVPAVGFSIGFERILSILAERGYGFPSNPSLALVYREGEEFAEALRAANALQPSYCVKLVPGEKSMGKLKKRLSQEGMGYLMELGGEMEALSR